MHDLSDEDLDRIIQMAWEDRTPFEAIRVQFGLDEAAVISLLRGTLKRRSFERWRKRVHGRVTKHAALRDPALLRFRCSRQRSISMNRISKR